MKELVDILKAFEHANKLGLRTALATVVHVQGSSYRRPGARMLIDETGMLTGAISGGCLEGDALRKALQVMMQQQPRLVTYDTADENDAGVGMQLGCEGIIQVLIEPLKNTADDGPMYLLKQACKGRSQKVLATFFSLQNKQAAQQGTALLMQEDGTIEGHLEQTVLLQNVTNEMAFSLQKSHHQYLHYQHGEIHTQVFLEHIPPAVQLVIGGAGNDVIPVVNMAQTLGWETMVLDGRPAYAKAERFATGCKVMVANPTDVLQQITVDARTAFVMMSHNYNYDKAMLQALLQVQHVLYIGMLGPKKKLEKMLDDFEGAGLKFSNEEVEKIYGPSGLEIGAETPEEIAVSIMAEIQAVLSDTPAGMLRNKKEVIHNRIANGFNFKKIDV